MSGVLKCHFSSYFKGHSGQKMLNTLAQNWSYFEPYRAGEQTLAPFVAEWISFPLLPSVPIRNTCRHGNGHTENEVVIGKVKLEGALE